jgi:L-ascorbate metabolism protein UlaG (beta-lactamase superfamily)
MNRFIKNKISLDEFLHSNYDGVYYVGHASIIVRIKRKNFLFDYVKDNLPYGDSWRFFPALIKDLPLKKIDGVFVSHLHQDHFDPVFLKDENLRCPIFIIGGRPAFDEKLLEHGINFISIPAGRKVEISDDVFVHGFLHENNGVDASCCIGNRNFSVYHGNDNYLKNDSLLDRDAEFSVIDIACVPYAYINWYPQLLDNLSIEDKQVESNRLCTYYFEYAIDQANKLQAKQVIPFGANLVYKDNARSPLNLECKTPLDFEKYVRNVRGELEGNRFMAQFSGDATIKEAEALVINSAASFNYENYRIEMQQFLDSLPKVTPQKEIKPLNFNVCVQKKITTPTQYTHYICIRPKNSDDGVMINTLDSSINKINMDFLSSRSIGYHLFILDEPSAYNDWLMGKIKIEEIIGARKFMIVREPNVYNKEILFIATTQI